MLQTYQGQIINGNMVLSEKVDLPENASFIITILDREILTQIKPQSSHQADSKPTHGRQNHKHTSVDKKIAMQEIRDLLSGIDGSSVDLNQARAERRSAKYERVD